MNRFLMFKLPSAYLCGVRLKELSTQKAVATVTYKWMNQNPFNSMYFAVQSMAAELTTGAIVIQKIQESGEKISMLVTNYSGAFTKKAIGKITFICNALKELVINIDDWSKEYRYDTIKNDYVHKTIQPIEKELVSSWFEI